jgi:hypothetical protein
MGGKEDVTLSFIHPILLPTRQLVKMVSKDDATLRGPVLDVSTGFREG